MAERNLETGQRGGIQESDDAGEYLTNLHRLVGELNRAMEAIVSQELPSLRESLHVQRSICARLSDLRQGPRVRLLLASPSNVAGCALSLEIVAATESLLAANRQYSALLTHAGETLRLLLGLHRGYAYPGQARTALALQTRTQSWYCEV